MPLMLEKLRPSMLPDSLFPSLLSDSFSLMDTDPLPKLLQLVGAASAYSVLKHSQQVLVLPLHIPRAPAESGWKKNCGGNNHGDGETVQHQGFSRTAAQNVQSHA